MSSKPTVNLWVLGARAYQWHQSLSPKNSYPLKPQTRESEARVYHLLRAPGLAECRGVVLFLSFHEIIPPVQRALLMVASRYTKELAVVICGMKGRSDEERDEEEECLREEFAELGFPADGACFVYELGALPSPEALSAVMSEFDQRDLIREMSPDLTPFPEGPDQLRAELYRLTKETVLPATMLSLTKSSAELHKLSTRFGGMPYIEQGEEWPLCQSCKRALCFMFQIDAAKDLQPTIAGAGLFTFYACGGDAHIQDEPQLTIRHYAAPSSEKAQERRAEASRKFASTGKAIAAHAVNRSSELQAPSLRELEMMGDEYKESKQHRIFRLLSPLAGEPDALSYEDVYAHAVADFGAYEVEKFTFNKGLPLQVGGYIDHAENCVTPLCLRCDGVMRTLAHIHEVKGLSFPFRGQALQFFICPCTPTNIKTVVRRESSEERYEREYE
jgi:hypothetical protein